MEHLLANAHFVNARNRQRDDYINCYILLEEKNVFED